MRSARIIFTALMLAVVICLLSGCGCVRLGGSNGEISINVGNGDGECDKGYTERYMSRSFDIADLDGDGEAEYIIHDLLGLTGGYGSYRLQVYKKGSGTGYKVIFDSEEYLKAHPDMDMTFTPISDGLCKLEHPDGFTAEYSANSEIYEALFYQNGKPKDYCWFAVDSFYSLEVSDTDSDGCDELTLKQYCSVGCHAQRLGECVSVFEYANGELVLSDIEMIID